MMRCVAMWCNGKMTERRAVEVARDAVAGFFLFVGVVVVNGNGLLPRTRI
jgi:hypothetical protein